MRLSLTSLAAGFAWVLMTWRPGWPAAAICMVAIVADVMAERFRSEREAQFAVLRSELSTATASHRAELERLHANLKEVGEKVRAIGNVQTMRGIK